MLPCNVIKTVILGVRITKVVICNICSLPTKNYSTFNIICSLKFAKISNKLTDINGRKFENPYMRFAYSVHGGLKSYGLIATIFKREVA